MKNIRIIFSLLLFIAGVSFSQPAMDEEILTTDYLFSQDKAVAGKEFKLAVEVKTNGEWHINSNKPLDEFLIPTVLSAGDGDNFSQVSVSYPHAEELTFDFSDDPVSVFEGDVFIIVTLNVKAGLAPGEYNLKTLLEYQACNNMYCSPPNSVDSTLTIEVVKEGTVVSFINNDIFNGATTPATGETVTENTSGSGSDIDKLLEEESLFYFFLFVFLGGLALNLTPCVYPLIPITVGYFGSQSSNNTFKLFTLGLYYVLGMALTYSLVGVITSLSGALFGALMQNPIVIIGVAVVLFVLSLSMFGVYEFKMPDSWAMKAGGAKSGGFGAFLMGLTMGIVAAPCIGPFVLALVTTVATKGDPVFGFFAFFTLAIGLGLPYLVLAVFSGKIKSLPRAGFWMETVKHIFGLVMIGMALYFLTPILPKSVGHYLLPVFMILASIYMIFIDKLANNLTGFRIFKTVLGIIIIAVASYLLYPAEKKSPEWQKFEMAKYEKSLRVGDKMIIDFYADWCVPCKEFDAITFQDERVIEKSKEFTNYKVDMTKANSEKNIELAKKFNVVGMPTIIFIDENGREIQRLVGFVNADEFLKIMQKI